MTQCIVLLLHCNHASLFQLATNSKAGSFEPALQKILTSNYEKQLQLSHHFFNQIHNACGVTPFIIVP